MRTLRSCSPHRYLSCLHCSRSALVGPRCHHHCTSTTRICVEDRLTLTVIRLVFHATVLSLELLPLQARQHFAVLHVQVLCFLRGEAMQAGLVGRSGARLRCKKREYLPADCSCSDCPCFMHILHGPTASLAMLICPDFL